MKHSRVPDSSDLAVLAPLQIVGALPAAASMISEAIIPICPLSLAKGRLANLGQENL
jgi:hypothetical protein